MYYIICNIYKNNTNDAIAKELLCWTDDENKLHNYLSNDDVKNMYDVEVYMYDCDWYQFLYILSKEYNVTNVDEKIYELKYMHTKTGKCCLTTKYWFTILIEEGDVVYDVLSELVESIIHLLEYIPYMNNSKEFKNMLTYLLINHIAPAIKLYRDSGDVYNSTIDLLGLLIQKGYMSELK